MEKSETWVAGLLSEKKDPVHMYAVYNSEEFESGVADCIALINPKEMQPTRSQEEAKRLKNLIEAAPRMLSALEKIAESLKPAGTLGDLNRAAIEAKELVNEIKS